MIEVTDLDGVCDDQQGATEEVDRQLVDEQDACRLLVPNSARKRQDPQNKSLLKLFAQNFFHYFLAVQKHSTSLTNFKTVFIGSEQVQPIVKYFNLVNSFISITLVST